jgi:peptidoglycan/xylan/chitin deacetylase (PgdA/CDA1 family)
VALTFDDGPGAATPQVLDVLQRAGVHATFLSSGGTQQQIRRCCEESSRAAMR